MNRPFAVMAAEQKNMVRPAGPTFAELLPKFLLYAEYDLKLAKRTAVKYKESLLWVQRHLPDVNGPAELCRDNIIFLKKNIQDRGAGASRVNSIIFALRKFLHFCNQVENITTLDLSELKPVRLPKREVIILPDAEIKQFMDSMNLNDRRDLRMRALAELLLSSGLRISEALSLNRGDIDWKNSEGMVIGKGNKQGKFYTTDRAKEFIDLYLETRKDDCPALFVTFSKHPIRLKQFDLSKLFKRYAARAGIKTKLTPHIFRHTTASILRREGADISDVQRILRHENVATTSRYYLHIDNAAIKAAYKKFLKY